MSEKTILLDHGSGGLASQELISGLFLKHLDNPTLHGLEDSAVLDNQPGRLAFTTDSYVVDPIFFPGGDIGKLAVHGTINDLAMRGARPICLSLAIILEEGMPLDDLERIVISISEACRESGVPIVTGDTKVVPKGKGDKIFINTSGIGIVDEDIDISSQKAQAGDVIILSGTMGDHGITIMTRRAGISAPGQARERHHAPAQAGAAAACRAARQYPHPARPDPGRGRHHPQRDCGQQRPQHRTAGRGPADPSSGPGRLRTARASNRSIWPMKASAW